MQEQGSSSSRHYWEPRCWEFLNHVTLVRKRELEGHEIRELYFFYENIMTEMAAALEQGDEAPWDGQKFDRDKRELLADFLENRLIPHLIESNKTQEEAAQAAALQEAKQEEAVLDTSGCPAEAPCPDPATPPEPHTEDPEQEDYPACLML